MKLKSAKLLGILASTPGWLPTQKKKPAEAQTETPRQEAPRIVFPASMTGSKPKVPSATSELKKTRAAEVDARKRKHKDASDDAPSKKKLKTKSSKKERAAASQPSLLNPSLTLFQPAPTKIVAL